MSRYSMLIQWSDEDKTYIVTLPEFPNCHTHGETYTTAARNGEEVLELLLASCREDGETLPAPHLFQAA